MHRGLHPGDGSGYRGQDGDGSHHPAHRNSGIFRWCAHVSVSDDDQGYTLGIAKGGMKMKEREIVFESDKLRLAGMLRVPDQGLMFPVVLLVHGSLEQDRDGNLLAKRDGKPAFKKNFFIEIARRLCASGYAAFSWDRRGCGMSEGQAGDVFTKPEMRKLP